MVHFDLIMSHHSSDQSAIRERKQALDVFYFRRFFRDFLNSTVDKTLGISFHSPPVFWFVFIEIGNPRYRQHCYTTIRVGCFFFVFVIQFSAISLWLQYHRVTTFLQSVIDSSVR